MVLANSVLANTVEGFQLHSLSQATPEEIADRAALSSILNCEPIKTIQANKLLSHLVSFIFFQEIPTCSHQPPPIFPLSHSHHLQVQIKHSHPSMELKLSKTQF
jgi:hypothetical protein